MKNGQRRIAWAERSMPVLRIVKERFAQNRPLAGQRIAACLRMGPETANLALTLQAGGAEVTFCATHPPSEDDEIASSLVADFGIPTRLQGSDDFGRPTITLDDGAELVSILHERRRDLLHAVIGGTEESTAGVIRLRALAARGQLSYPIVALNDAVTKQLFESRHGTGQSKMDGIVRATNVLLAGMPVVVAGYGWVGKGIALRARGLGAQVTVCEVAPVAALEACMDGFRVLPMRDAAKEGQMFITATGSSGVIGEGHFEAMPDTALLANAGRDDLEIDVDALARRAVARRTVRDLVEEFELADGRRIHLFAGGKILHLAAGESHPATILDMSCAHQSLAVEFLVARAGHLDATVLPVPKDIDQRVVALKLLSLGVCIDEVTPERRRDHASWSDGA